LLFHDGPSLQSAFSSANIQYRVGRADQKSTVFLRLTSRYVDAGSAKLGEILLPIDHKAFSIDETPVPELIRLKDDVSQIVHEQYGPLWRPTCDDETATGQQPAPVTPLWCASYRGRGAGGWSGPCRRRCPRAARAAGAQSEPECLCGALGQVGQVPVQSDPLRRALRTP
jgi:hypothetical protein